MRRAFAWTLALGLFVWLLWDWRRNWQGPELASHPDEAGHFVTGRMVFDYLSRHCCTPPLRFAEEYYAHYPKVALGHWPPAYYLLQAPWFALWGNGIGAAHGLNLAISILFLLLWVCFLKGWVGWALALGSGAFLLSVPVLLRGSLLVLSDWMVVLGFSLTLWLTAERRWEWAAAVGAATILTKGNAWPLLFVPILASLLSRESAWWKQRRLWFSLAFMLLLGAPFYLWARSTGLTYPLRNLERFLEGPLLWTKFHQFWEMLGFWSPLLWVLAIVGSWRGCNESRTEFQRWWACALAAVLSMSAFLLLSGLSFEDRVLSPILPALFWLAIYGAEKLLRKELWLLLLILVALREGTTIQTELGYREIAAELPPAGRTASVLVASGAIGEGAMVAQRLALDENLQGIVRRASRALSKQGWIGNRYSEVFQEDKDVARWLSENRVHYVVVDDSCVQPHCERLRRLRGEWKLMRVWKLGTRNIETYQIVANEGKAVEHLDVVLGKDRGERKLTVPLR